MKSEHEILSELQRVRAVISDTATNGKSANPLLTGAEQALGWALDRLRAPSEAEELIRRQHAARKAVRIK